MSNKVHGMMLFLTIAALVVIPGLAVILMVLWMLYIVAKDDRSAS